MYFILDGRVRLVTRAYGSERTVATLGKGEFFGELSVLTGQHRSNTAVTLTDCQLLPFDRPGLETLIRVNPTTAHQMILTLAVRLQSERREVELLRTTDPAARLAIVLADLATERGTRRGAVTSMEATTDELMDLSGLARLSVEQAIDQLTKGKLMRKHGALITIPGAEALRLYAANCQAE